MHWRSSMRLEEKLETLRLMSDPKARGREFESFLAEMFGREHFRARKDFAADGRQIDLHVSRGDLHLLIEAKWLKARAQHAVIDSILARLRTAPPGVAGLVVSMSGFSSAVVERVGRTSERPILLLDGQEVERVVSNGGGLDRLLRTKLDVLMRERKALVGASSPITQRTWMQELPESDLRIIDRDGHPRTVWESWGDFHEQVDSLVPPDPNWAHAGSVNLLLKLDVRDCHDLLRLLRRLAQLGFVSSEGTWRIEQAGVAWCGLGPAELARQLIDSDSRYRGRTFHHSERVMYVEESDQGLVAITVDMSVHHTQLIRWCDVSFVLPGIPLDMSPFHGLVAELPVLNSPHFETLQVDPVQRRNLRARGKPRGVTPAALLVRDTSAAGQGLQWVEGLITSVPMMSTARHPVTSADRIAAALTHQSRNALVRLHQHHQVGDDVRYDLYGSSLLQILSVNVHHAWGDWAWTDPDARPRIPRSD